MKAFYNLNDNLVRIEGLRDASAGGAYLNAATVTATLNDPSGDPITGATAIGMSYVSNSEGDYEGVLQSTISVTDGLKYTLVIDAVQGGAVGHWEVKVEVVTRRGV